jgi:hypothetical protein
VLLSVLPPLRWDANRHNELVLGQALSNPSIHQSVNIQQVDARVVTINLHKHVVNTARFHRISLVQFMTINKIIA